jgi:hypothetical protein
MGHEFEPSGRGQRRRISRRKLNVVVRMPPTLKYALQVAALDRRSNLSETIIDELAAFLEVQLKPRRARARSPFGGGPKNR